MIGYFELPPPGPSCAPLFEESVRCFHDSARAWHLELEICIVRHRIKFCECGSSEQGMIVTAEWDYVED